MKITIMHLYYDLLNLHGESGNIKVLKSVLEDLGIKVQIKFTTIDEIIDLKNIDLLYISSGTINNQKLALEHIKKYKNEINDYIENGGYVLATGNALDLFGKNINYLDEKQSALEIFSFESTELNFKIADEILAESDLTKDYIIGFTNRSSIIKDEIKNPLFKIIKGTGKNINEKNEGIHYKNFFGTYIIGPLLVRNPSFLKYFVKSLLKNNQKINFNKINLSLEKKAYDEFLNNYYKEFAKK